MTSEHDEIFSAYVFVELPDEEESVLAGRLILESRRSVFFYGKSYLNRPDAFAFDPINLPLVNTPQIFAGQNHIPAVLLDAGPDNWGKRLMYTLHKRTPRNAVEELLATRGAGVGALSFSLSRTRPKSTPEFESLKHLLALDKGISDLLESNLLTPEVVRLFEPGSSMGGARPKSVVQDETGALWIAKFNRPEDLFDQAAAEQMCYLMMRECAINACQTRLIRAGGRHVLLVRRFDQTAAGRRLHFISAHALMYQPRVRVDDVPVQYAYPRLASLIDQIGDRAEQDKTELFRRMVFNILVGNSDDHLRNHGLLKNISDHHYRLTPAYDVVPQPGQFHLQAIGVGQKGRESSLENALSASQHFGLSTTQAESIIKEIAKVTYQWRDYAEQAELSEADCRILSEVMELDRSVR